MEPNSANMTKPKMLPITIAGEEFEQLYAHFMNNFTAAQALPILQFFDVKQNEARMKQASEVDEAVSAIIPTNKRNARRR